jgi:hypothetical protein
MFGEFYSGMFYMGPEAPPPPALTKDILAYELSLAIEKKDVEAVRGIFDQAFWHKIEFKPDWYHLLHAVSLADKPMIRLLTTHGATWTAAQSQLLSQWYHQNWQEFAALLRGTSIQTKFKSTEEEPDPYTLITMAYRFMDDRRYLFNTIDVAVDKDEMLSRSIVRAFLDQDQALGLRFLTFRHPETPVVFDREFEELLKEKCDVLSILDRMESLGTAVQPIAVSMRILYHHPDMVLALEDRALLEKDAPDARMESLRALISESRRPLAPPYDSYRRVAALYVTHGGALTEQEVDNFIILHRVASSSNAPFMEKVRNDLHAMGFFSGAGWTPKKLQALAAEMPAEAGLKEVFNKRIAKEASKTSSPKKPFFTFKKGAFGKNPFGKK